MSDQIGETVMQKYSFKSVLIFVLLLLVAVPCSALVDTPEALIVEPGETITLSGNVYKSVSIHVKDGGIINVLKYDGTSENIGKLNLIAPQIIIGGTINATAVSYNEAGAGGAPGAKWNGGGGAGYGGDGGDGHDVGAPGPGGSSYDITYLEDVGSYGWGADIEAAYGLGGGCIRLDAISLTLGATAQLFARGNPIAYARVGGGSGGCILLNGIYTSLKNNYLLDVSGGPGGEAKNPFGAAGGGGGGRIKFIQHYTFDNQGGTIYLNGGGSGGGTAEAGLAGTSVVVTAPSPNAPILKFPENGQQVGTTPTFTFVATDPADSKFLKYRLEISLNDTFSSPVTITADQLANPDDPGWGGKPYFSSGEQASYVIQAALTTGTAYYWRVSVTNNEGANWVTSTEYRQFTTTDTVNVRPVKPQLTQPSQDQTNVSKTPAFQILCADPDGDTMTCVLILSKDQELSSPQIFQASYAGWDQAGYFPGGEYIGITATCQILNSGSNLDALVPGTDYYWKAMVYDAFQQSNVSDIYHFITVDKPAVPVIVSPANNTIVTTKTPSLKVVSQSPTASLLNYKIELSSDNYQTILSFQSQNGGGWSKSAYTSGETAELVIPAAYALIPGQSYSWRAYAYDIDNDNWSLVTTNYTFTVITPPLVPVLISPEENYEAPNSQITFQFKAESESGNTLNGRFELSENNFSTTLYSFDQTQDQTGWSKVFYHSNSTMAFTLPVSIQLERGKTYWWRVYATDGISWGPASEIRCLSLTNVLEFQAVRTIPNPAVSTDTLQIHVQLSVDADITIRFYNKLGKEVDQFHTRAQGGTQGNIFNYNISKYASGVYFYVIEARSIFGMKKITKRFAVVN